jgi:hypothetical protein
MKRIERGRKTKARLLRRVPNATYGRASVKMIKAIMMFPDVLINLFKETYG